METIRNIYQIAFDFILAFRNTVSVANILDILIVAFIIYKVLTFMHKTSASSVMKGIAFVIAVVWISNLLNLTVLSFLLRHVVQMGVLVLIILFQPEIRKMFERMGTSRLNLLFARRSKNSENIESGIVSVASACEAMAKTHTGAIIVFEREVGLNDFAVTGTEIEAVASSDLIQSIFFENSPLHDGALIIREGKLLAAACMLPLSNNINLSRDLGMRHRAGVGISERSDAVVVIVSEESGTISIAVDGMLKRHLSKETIDKLLRQELILAGSTKSDKPDKSSKSKQKENK